MDETAVIEMCREAIIVMLKLSGPAMLITMVVGLAISLFQALTHIQEQTLTFVPKMVLVFGLSILLMPWMLATLVTFTEGLADRIVALGTL
ncbi:MAG TPA: flagellar biosynthesis protein FliQ [Azospirillaceae bacterium]|nr:flagellar biosynthesis protein FliQ [Azospirillaceae bacterium]